MQSQKKVNESQYHSAKRSDPKNAVRKQDDVQSVHRPAIVTIRESTRHRDRHTAVTDTRLMCTRSSCPHHHVQSREYHHKTCGNEHGRPTNITLAQLKEMRELQKNCSTGCSLRHEGDNRLIGRPRLPLQNPTWPTILPDLSHRCQFHPLSVFALHFLAALLELTLNFFARCSSAVLGLPARCPCGAEELCVEFVPVW